MALKKEKKKFWHISKPIKNICYVVTHYYSCIRSSLIKTLHVIHDSQRNVSVQNSLLLKYLLTKDSNTPAEILTWAAKHTSEIGLADALYMCGAVWFIRRVRGWLMSHSLCLSPSLPSPTEAVWGFFLHEWPHEVQLKSTPPITTYLC